MYEKEPIDEWLQELGPTLPVTRRDELRRHLIEAVNHLLVHRFDRLVQILYRVDVSEKKLKQLLQAHPDTDAAVLIADLLIERQIEKIKTRESFQSNDPIPDDEKW